MGGRLAGRSNNELMEGREAAFDDNLIGCDQILLMGPSMFSLRQMRVWSHFGSGEPIHTDPCSAELRGVSTCSMLENVVSHVSPDTCIRNAQGVTCIRATLFNGFAMLD